MWCDSCNQKSFWRHIHILYLLSFLPSFLYRHLFFLPMFISLPLSLPPLSQLSCWHCEPPEGWGALDSLTHLSSSSLFFLFISLLIALLHPISIGSSLIILILQLLPLSQPLWALSLCSCWSLTLSLYFSSSKNSVQCCLFCPLFSSLHLSFMSWSPVQSRYRISV